MVKKIYWTVTGFKHVQHTHTHHRSEVSNPITEGAKIKKWDQVEGQTGSVFIEK